MTTLGLSVGLKTREPAHGLEMRLAHRVGVGVTGLSRFSGYAGASLQTPDAVRRLARTAGLDETIVVQTSPRRLEGTRIVELGLAQTFLGDWSTRSRRFCGVCFLADRQAAAGSDEPTGSAAWHRCEWDFRSVLTCVDHNRLLSDRCSVCGAVQGWKPARLDVCPCGHILTSPEIRIPASTLDRAFVDALNGVQGLPAHLGGCLLGHASAFLQRLGMLNHGWRATRPEPRKADMISVRDLGLDLWIAGESEIGVLLDQILAGAPKKHGVCHAYGWVWNSWLGVPSPCSLVASLRRMVRAHAVENGVISPAEGTGGTISLASTKSILGVGHARGRRILEHLGGVHPASRRGVALAIDEASVRTFSLEQAKVADAKVSARHLAVGKTQFRSLVTAGVVQAAADPASCYDGKVFAVAELDGLVAALAGDAPFVDGVPVGCVSIPQACRTASIPLPVLVSAMKSGTVRAIARTRATGLLGVIVTVQEVLALRRPRITVRWAAGVLGLHYEAARALAAMGELGPEIGMVTEEHVAAFSRAYLTAAQAGAEARISGHLAARRLDEAGIRPRFGPPQCRQAVYERCQATMVLLPAKGCT